MTQRMPAAAYRALPKAKKNKYGAKRTTLDGITFASKAESAYYAKLKQRETAGEVANVELQKRYAMTIGGFLICTYVSDFDFYDITEKRQRTVDTKGVITDVFRIKRKLMKAIHGIDVEIVK